MMRRKIVRFSILPVVAGCMFFSFSTKKAANLEIEGYSTSSLDLNYTVALVKENELEKEINFERALPKLGKSYDGFKEAVAFKESRGNYRTINEFGYMGKYQFGIGTLELLGIYNGSEFLNYPQLQEAAFYTNTSRNKWILIRDIARFEGKVINGVKVTESGILAAAHLAGPGSVKKYLRSFGAQAFSDAFGTSIKNYMKRFEGYDTSFIKPVQNPRVDIKAFRA
jgi:hypothetical protein